MDQNSNSNMGGTGYLVVKVSTAQGAIPLQNASVTVRGGEKENSGVLYSLTTNRDGLTQKVALPAPARALSEVPGNDHPFEIYSVDVFKDGYIDQKFTDVAIFDSITSVQVAVMIPLPDNKYKDSYAIQNGFNRTDRKSGTEER